MKKNLNKMSFFAVLFLVSGIIFAPLFASEEVKVSVKGMVCAYCSSGVEKSFNRQKEVETVKVDLDARLVHLKFKTEQSLSDEKITEVITKAGLNVETIQRLSK